MAFEGEYGLSGMLPNPFGLSVAFEWMVDRRTGKKHRNFTFSYRRYDMPAAFGL
jgi:hypothetical protein